MDSVTIKNCFILSLIIYYDRLNILFCRIYHLLLKFFISLQDNGESAEEFNDTGILSMESSTNECSADEKIYRASLSLNRYSTFHNISTLRLQCRLLFTDLPAELYDSRFGENVVFAGGYMDTFINLQHTSNITNVDYIPHNQIILTLQSKYFKLNKPQRNFQLQRQILS